MPWPDLAGPCWRWPLAGREADLAPEALRGTAYGWFHLVTGALLLPASMIFGWLYNATGAAGAFAFSASCATLAAGLLQLWVGLPAPDETR